MIEKQPEHKIMLDISALVTILKGTPVNIFFDGAKEEDIATMEKRLGVKLPDSFRQFLRVSDGALFYQGEEIFGTKNGEHGLQRSIDRIKAQSASLPANFIPFYSGNEVHYFDTNNLANGEYIIYALSSIDGSPRKIADSFPQWLKERIIDENEASNFDKLLK